MWGLVCVASHMEDVTQQELWLLNVEPLHLEEESHPLDESESLLGLLHDLSPTAELITGVAGPSSGKEQATAGVFAEVLVGLSEEDLDRSQGRALDVLGVLIELSRHLYPLGARLIRGAPLTGRQTGCDLVEVGSLASMTWSAAATSSSGSP